MKTAYFINQTVVNEKGEYIPCIAKEGETGYYKTDWAWGRDLKVAEQIADEKNEGMGLTKKEAMTIVLRSMRG